MKVNEIYVRTRLRGSTVQYMYTTFKNFSSCFNSFFSLSRWDFSVIIKSVGSKVREEHITINPLRRRGGRPIITTLWVLSLYPASSMHVNLIASPRLPKKPPKCQRSETCLSASLLSCRSRSHFPFPLNPWNVSQVVSCLQKQEANVLSGLTNQTTHSFCSFPLLRPSLPRLRFSLRNSGPVSRDPPSGVSFAEVPIWPICSC